MLFAWEDCRSYQFIVRPRRPLPDASQDELLRRSVSNKRRFSGGDSCLTSFQRGDDPRGATLAEVLHAVRDKLRYVYGCYGGEWKHNIQVEHVEPATADNTRDLPQCTAGRAAAPVEDTEGVARHTREVWFYRMKKGLLPASWIAEQEQFDDDEKAVRRKVEEEYIKSMERWLEYCSTRLGTAYDPLYFDKAAVDRALKQPLRDRQSRAVNEAREERDSGLKICKCAAEPMERVVKEILATEQAEIVSMEAIVAQHAPITAYRTRDISSFFGKVN